MTYEQNAPSCDPLIQLFKYDNTAFVDGGIYWCSGLPCLVLCETFAVPKDFWLLRIVTPMPYSTV